MYKWTKMGNIPADLPTFGRAMFQIESDIYFFGGYSNYWIGHVNDPWKYAYSTNVAYKYDCLTDTWSTFSPIPDGLTHSQMFSFIIDGIAYLGGGVTGLSYTDVASSAYTISNYINGHVDAYPASRAFDKLNSEELQYWLIHEDNLPGWVGQDFGEGNEKIITRYSVAPRMDAMYGPATWTFEASITGAWAGEEVILDTRTDISWESSAPNVYDIPNSNSYRFYRLNITDGVYNDFTGVGELMMFEMSYGISDTFWSYDPAQDLWTQLGNFGGGTRRAATSFAIQGKGYVSGGCNTYWVPVDGQQVSGHQCYAWDIWEYTPGTDTWDNKTETVAYSGTEFGLSVFRGYNHTTQQITGERGRAYVVESYPLETDITSSDYAISNYPLGWAGDGTYSMDKAFDKNNGTIWHTNNPDGGTNSPGGEPWWIGQDFETAKKIHKYSITNRPESPGESPRDWTFQASNTGEWNGEEVILDTQTEIVWTGANETKTFEIVNNNFYRYYRLYITWSNYYPDPGYCVLAEVKMYTFIDTAVDTPYALCHAGFIRGSNGDLYPVAGAWTYQPIGNIAKYEGYWRSSSREGYYQEGFVILENQLRLASLLPTYNANMYFPTYDLGPSSANGCTFVPWLQVEEGQYNHADPSTWNYGNDGYILDVGVLYKYSYINNVPLYYQNIRRIG